MNCVCINMNNLKTFKLSFKIHHKSALDYKWLIFREDKLGTNDEDLINFLNTYDVNYEIIHSNKLDELLLEKLPVVYNSKLYKHLSMNWNFLMTWYIMNTMHDVDKIFVIEEDIFINIDLSKIFKYNKNGYVYSSLSLGGMDFPMDKRFTKFSAWLSCINMPLTPDTWYNNIVIKKAWGGPRLHVLSTMPSDYEQRIINVYTNDDIFNTKSNRWHCGYYDELFHSIIENDDSVQLNDICKHEMLRKFTIENCKKWLYKEGVYHFGGSVKNEKLILLNKLKGVTDGDIS